MLSGRYKSSTYAGLWYNILRSTLVKQRMCKAIFLINTQKKCLLSQRWYVLSDMLYENLTSYCSGAPWSITTK